MKKIFTLISAIMLCSSVAMADPEVIGADTKGWADPGCNKVYTLAPNKTITFDFVVNSSRGAGDADGWVTRAQAGEKDYYFMQPIGYAVTDWGWGVAGKSIDEPEGSWYLFNRKNYDYGTFKTDIVGATVKVEIKRLGEKLYQTTDITTKAIEAVGETPAVPSKKFRQYFVMETDATKDLTITFGSDFATIALNSDAITDSEDPEDPAGTLIGNHDNTTKWWQAFSEYFTIAENQTLTLDFINYTCKVENFHNWLVGVTTDEDRNNGENYKEFFILRSDNYAWGVYGNTNSADQYYSDKYHLTSDYNWDAFKDDFNGAAVKMTVTRQDQKITANAVISPKGKDYTYTETLWVEVPAAELASTANIRAWLTTEGGHIVLTGNSISNNTDAINTIENTAKPAKAVRYNLAGQQVNGSYKGVVIENGRKVVIK